MLSGATEEGHPGGRGGGCRDTDAISSANHRGSDCLGAGPQTVRVGGEGGWLHNATIYGCHGDFEHRHRDGGRGGDVGGGTTFEAFLIHDDGVVLRRLRQAEELTSEWDRSRRGRSDSRPGEGRKHLKVPHGAKFNLPLFSAQIKV